MAVQPHATAPHPQSAAEAHRLAAPLVGGGAFESLRGRVRPRLLHGLPRVRRLAGRVAVIHFDWTDSPGRRQCRSAARRAPAPDRDQRMAYRSGAIRENSEFLTQLDAERTQLRQKLGITEKGLLCP